MASWSGTLLIRRPTSGAGVPGIARRLWQALSVLPALTFAVVLAVFFVAAFVVLCASESDT